VRFGLKPFLRFLETGDREALVRDYRQLAHEHQRHFAGQLSVILGVITGDVDEAQLRNPAYAIADQSAPFYRGMRAEVAGDKAAAIEAYKQVDAVKSPWPVRLASWRLRVLTASVK
jgi:hypothetical protein